MAARGKTGQVAGVIPARWGSSRFPGKPLHQLAGKSLLGHVIERVGCCKRLDVVLVATDDERIQREARANGAEVVMTSGQHKTGTDRVAEAITSFPAIQHIVNIQGDEPLVSPSLIDLMADTLRKQKGVDMITAANPISDLTQLDDPNIVKVVLNRSNDALYFSRSALPYNRSQGDLFSPFRHVGLYGYQRGFLEKFVSWPEGDLERVEQLEQLRALENGSRIRVVVTEHDSIGLDTPEQVPEIEALLAGSTDAQYSPNINQSR